MSLNDTTSDMLATLRNGQMAKIEEVIVYFSKTNASILNVLQQQGYIESFAEIELRKGVKRLSVKLRYHSGQPVIRYIKRVSRPGLRNYSAIKSLGKSFNGLGLKILSTSKGILSDVDAKKLNVGGEVVCEIF